MSEGRLEQETVSAGKELFILPRSTRNRASTSSGCNNATCSQSVDPDISSELQGPLWQGNEADTINVNSSSCAGEEDLYTHCVACSVIASCLHRMCGVMPLANKHPWASVSYQSVLILAVLAIVVVNIAKQSVTFLLQGQVLYPNLIDAVIGTGCLCGLIQMSLKRQKQTEVSAMIRSEAAMRGVTLVIERVTLKDVLISFSLCASAVLVRAYTVPDVHAFHVISFAVFSCVFMAMTTYILGLCRSLVALIDNFCSDANANQDFTSCIPRWNTVYSYSRELCEAMQLSFLVMQTTVMGVLMISIRLVGQGIGSPFILVPGLLIALDITRICIVAAKISDQCFHVPRLINSVGVSDGDPVNSERIYATDFISRCQAGFYIFETRLTSAMLLRSLYVSVAAVVTLASFSR